MGKKATSVIDAAAIRAEQGHRAAWWLRQKFQRHTAKLAAQALGVDERTIKKLLEGYPPSADLLAKLAAPEIGGWAFVALVFAPVCGEQVRAEVVAQDIRAIEDDLAKAKAKLAELEASK